MRSPFTILLLLSAFIGKSQQTPGDKVVNTGNVPTYLFYMNETDSISKVQWNAQEAHFIEGRRVFKVAEKMPEFPGGKEKMMDCMLKNIKVNADDDFVAEIKLTFVVDTNGVCKN